MEMKLGNNNLFITYEIDGDGVLWKFDFNQTVIDLVKTIKGRKWSATDKVWKIPYSENYLQNLNGQSKGKLIFKEMSETTLISNQLPKEYLETIKLKNYSQPTIKTYCSHFQRFLDYYPNTNLNEIKKEQIREYLLYLVDVKKYSTSAQNQAINSIKFYFEKVLGKPVEKYYVPRPRKEKKLPEVLSEEEVTKILKQISNLKHQCVIFLIYSAGLRISEAINLKINEIDYNRSTISIKQAKGKKDRTVPLSKRITALINEYLTEYTPNIYLFEGQTGGKYSPKSIQNIFHAACEKAGIKKSNRTYFAT